MPENAAPEATSEAPLSAAELESLGLDGSAAGVDTSLQLSGFVDFSVVRPIKPRGTPYLTLPIESTMFVGNLNLYLSKQLSESFRTMMEIRFAYLPNGTRTTDPVAPTTSTQVADYAQLNHTVRWGGIMIQRVYLDWTLHRYLVLRGGQFLTPYGIWNVDHGSPTIIPAQRPQAIDNGLFPEQQTGLEAFGRIDATNYDTLGYHLTLSNGSGPISEYRDLDRNKTVGGRLFWESARVGTLRLGTSAFYGQDTNAQYSWSLMGDAVDYKKKVLQQRDQLGLAADLLFKIRGLHIQAEWVSVQRRYTAKGRTLHDVPLGPTPKGYAADSLSWGSYVLLAYQLPWYGITPFTEFEYAPEIIGDIHANGRGFHVGLNVKPIDAVTLKMEYGYGEFWGGGPLLQFPLQALVWQAAWAF